MASIAPFHFPPLNTDRRRWHGGCADFRENDPPDRRTAGRRVILTLNDVKIGDHGDQARARAQAEGMIEAAAEHMARRQAGEPAERAHEA